MKCKYCGGEVSLSEKYCPYCGKLNEQTAAHAEAMKKFRKDYAETKAGVEETTKRFTGTAVNAVIIAVLAVLLVVSIVIGNRAWDISYEAVKADAVKREAAYSQIMDGYLLNEQFLEFNTFAERHGTSYYYRDAYASFLELSRVVYEYKYFYEAITEVIEAKKYRDAEYQLSSLNHGLSGFFEYADEYAEKEDVIHTEIHDRAVQVMEYNIRLLLETYLGMDENGLAEYRSASEGTRLTMIENAVQARFGGAE